METLNQKRDSWTAWIFFVSVLFIAATMLTGCGDDKKKGGGTIAVAPDNGGRIVHPNCGACSSYTDQLATAANASMDDAVDFAIALYSPAMGAGKYQGPVDVAGYLEVFSTPITECPFQPGYYRLRVPAPNGIYADNQSGTWNLTGLRLEAIHDNGLIVELEIPYMEFYDAQTVLGVDGYEYANTLRGEIYVLRADGYQCGWPGVPRKIFFIQK